MNQETLGKENIGKLFLKYVVPGIFGMIILSLYGIIDGLFIGNTVGPYGIAAMNLIMPYLSIVMAISITITVGGTTFIGIELGKGNKEETNRIFTLTALTMVVVGIIFALCSFLFSKQIANLLGATEITFNYVNSYIRTISPFVVFYMLGILLDLVLRASGRPLYAMIALVISGVLNIVFDYIFVVRLSLGTTGAAFATGIAFTIGCVIFALPYMNKNFSLRLIRTKIDFSIINKLIYNGLSEGLTEVSTAIVTFLFNITLLKYLGELGVSSYTIIGYISYITTAILIGISDGIKPIISYNYGAKKYSRIKSTYRLSIIVAIIIGICTVILVDIGGEELIKLFVNADESLINITMNGAKIYTLVFLINGINIVASAYFTSIAKAKESMIISLSRGLVLVSIGLMVFPMIWGINGIWIAVPIADAITLIITFILLKKNSIYEK